MDANPLPGYGLQPVELADIAVLNPYLTSLAEPLSDYTFSQIFSWRRSLRILWKEIDGHLCIFANGTGDLTLLMPPVGQSAQPDRALRRAFELMDDYNSAHGVSPREHSRIEYASDELLARFNRTGLDVRPMGTDYVYDVRRMIDLAGGDLKSKRQEKNRFLRHYESRFRVETYVAASHLQGCRALLDSWKTHQDAQHLEEPNANAIKRQKESIATAVSLEHADVLGLRGMVVYVTNADGVESIRGFTFGEPLGRDQSSIVIEKTDLEVKGLAQFIFSEFCATAWADRPFVNAGDDWGLESLAWTKMSYRPTKLLQKYVIARPCATSFASVPVVASAPAETLVRPARKDDLAAAVVLEQSCFDAYRLSKRQLQYLQAQPTAVFLVAEQAQKVIGEGIALIRQHKTGFSGRIYSLAVDSTYRGQKIGRRLLRQMLDELAARGVRRVYLEVDRSNATAVQLYQNHGFRSVETLPNYYGLDRDGLRMMLEVPMAIGITPTAA